MADLFNMLKITVGPDKLTARVLVNPGAPVRTSEDIEGTARVYYLAPGIATHACLGDAGEHFQDCMADTELAHLLEHLTVEIMKQTGLAGDVVSGRGRAFFRCLHDAVGVPASRSAGSRLPRHGGGAASARAGAARRGRGRSGRCRQR